MCARRPARRAAFARLASYTGVATLAMACQLAEPPELLSVHRVTPARASAGDRLVITGEGFPEGRPATVTFRGTLHRPGTAPQTDVQVSLPASPFARDAVAVAFDRGVEQRFAGSGAGAIHTTFRGDLRVVFEPSASGVARVGGTARSVHLDVLPTTPAQEATEAEAPGAAALAWLGITATEEPLEGGLRVGAVHPEGRAAAAGLASGDLMMELDGVTLLSLSDLRGRAGQRTATLLVERGGRPLPALTIDVDGLSPRGVADLSSVFAVAALAATLLLLPMTRLGAVFAWLERLFTTSARAPGARSRAVAAFEALLPPRFEHGAPSAAALLVLAAVVGSFAWLSFGHALVSPDLDLVVLASGPMVAVLATRFVTGGSPSGRWSITAALSGTASSAACLFPAVVALAGAILSSGRFVIAEMVSEQGGAPWRWAGFRNPGLSVLSLLLLATTVVDAGERTAALAAEGLSVAPRGRMRTVQALARLAEWGYLWVALGLSAALFLGGWRVPGVSAVDQEGARWLCVAGAALFVLKLGALGLAVGAVRSAAGRVAVEHVAPLALRWGAPLAIAAFVASAFWATVLDGSRSQAAADLAAHAALLLALVAFGAGAALWLRRSVGSAAPASVNPWI